MLNKAAKLALVATSLAPICLTLWFVEFSKQWDWQQSFSKQWDWQQSWGYLVSALALSLICYGLIKLSASKHFNPLEWLEGVDNQIYQTHDFYKRRGWTITTN